MKDGTVIEILPKIASGDISDGEFRYASDDNVNVDVVFIDLRNADKCMANLIAKVC